MTNALHEQARAADFILREADPTITREVVTVTGGDYQPGSVLSASDGQYGPLNAQHADIVVVYTRIDASEEAKNGLVIARHCSLKSSHLFWPEGISAADKLIAIKKMEQKMLIIRGGH